MKPLQNLLLLFVLLANTHWASAAPTTSTASSPTPDRAPLRCRPFDAESLKSPYVFNRGISAAKLQSDYFGKPEVANDGSLNDLGYRPVRLTGYTVNGEVRYAAKWVKDDGPAWTSKFGLTGAQFHARYLTLRTQGFRILDASGYNTSSGVRYADIWIKNTAGLRGAITRDVPLEQMELLKASMRSEGLAPTHIEGYMGAGKQPQFIVTWVESSCDWDMEQDLTGAQYQQFYDAHKATMRALHVDAYAIDSKVRYASIFWKQNGPAVRASHAQHWYLFQAAVNRNICDGYVPDSFYGMQLPSHWEAYGAIWRYRGKPSVSAASSIGARMGYRVDCAPGRAGAALINVTTGETVLAHGDQPFGSASAIKITVLYALLRKADAENVNLDVKTISQKKLSVLATEMIVDSNNASTNTLIDYVGMDQVNAELDALGLKVVRLQRYLSGGPSAHGLGSWFDDFKAGYDNFVTPRELATFYKLVYLNDGLLSGNAYNRFLTITAAAPTSANNAFAAGYDPVNVRFYNKAGSKTYEGNPGDFAHRPQLGRHSVGSEGGVMAFNNGNLVFYATIVDQRDPDVADSTIACVGWEAAMQWGPADGSLGDSSGLCPYP